MSLLSVLSDNCNIPYKFNVFSECFHIFAALTETRLFPEVQFSYEFSEVNLLFSLTSRTCQHQKVTLLLAFTFKQSISLSTETKTKTKTKLNKITSLKLSTSIYTILLPCLLCHLLTFSSHSPLMTEAINSRFRISSHLYLISLFSIAFFMIVS